MLLKLNRIKNLGVFSDYTWDGGLPPFERYNVIYGDNGSGKTTLSRLLDCLNAGGHQEYPDLEYKIETQSGELVHARKAARKVRVFNADYVQLNIGQLDGGLKHILVIGEENKAIAETITKQSQELAGRELTVTSENQRIVDLQKSRGKLFTEIAKTISEAVSGNTARTYRKNDAEAAFGKLLVPKTLTDDEIATHRATIRQEVMDKIDTSPPLHTDVEGETLSPVMAGQKIAANAKALCARVAASEAVARLAENPDISVWVEQGYKLHKERGSSDCEFCGQAVPGDRWKQLESHFSAADHALKADIERTLSDLTRLVVIATTTTLPDRMAIYSELRDGFDKAKAHLDKACEVVLGELQAVQQALWLKQTSRSHTVEFDGRVDFGDFDKAWAAVNVIIDAHNQKTAVFNDAKTNTQNEIESHYLTSIQADVSEYDVQIASAKKIVEEAQAGEPANGILSMDSLSASIAEKKAELSNAHKAAEQLTAYLHTFLGRNELVFQSEDDGYRICRNGKIARRLSEGERTAIAFIYFIVQLTDQDFDSKEGIVVIDDPVSSLDASSVYQAFAFLKNAVKEAKQVFLFTHNFAFLRLVINWFENIKKAEGKKQFYMLICASDQAGRRSTIAGLDRALIDHPTEYHFLFKTLATFQGNGTIGACYHIPNVTRKVLETFLDFYVPERKALFAKLADVSFDENKKTAIYKFANDLSHFTGQGFEPGLVAESQKNSAYLLEMIKELAPQHYDGMMAAIS